MYISHLNCKNIDAVIAMQHTVLTISKNNKTVTARINFFFRIATLII